MTDTTVSQEMKMTDDEFRAFLNLMMCSDPWPTESEIDYQLCLALASEESWKRGYENWIVAYHEMPDHD